MEDITSMADVLAATENETKLLVVHPVKPHVKEAVGISKETPAAVLVHVTNSNLGYNIAEHGFVNVSGRGTLAPIIDNANPNEDVGVPSIVGSKVNIEGSKIMMLTFCLPSDKLKLDDNGRYGIWYDNKLHSNQKPELWEVYNRIVVEYDDETGEPKKYAKDDPELYPVWIPPQYILGIAVPSDQEK